MFDIGIGEIVVIALIALLVFGPDRLPRAAADAAKWLGQIRQMASGARKDLVDSAGIDLSDAVDTVKSLQEFHPRRLAAGLLDGSTDPGTESTPTAPKPTAADAGDPPQARPSYDPDTT